MEEIYQLNKERLDELCVEVADMYKGLFGDLSQVEIAAIDSFRTKTIALLNMFPNASINVRVFADKVVKLEKMKGKQVDKQGLLLSNFIRDGVVINQNTKHLKIYGMPEISLNNMKFTYANSEDPLFDVNFTLADSKEIQNKELKKFDKVEENVFEIGELAYCCPLIKVDGIEKAISV